MYLEAPIVFFAAEGGVLLLLFRDHENQIKKYFSSRKNVLEKDIAVFGAEVASLLLLIFNYFLFKLSEIVTQY